MLLALSLVPATLVIVAVWIVPPVLILGRVAWLRWRRKW
jgi:hypothetical protein